MDGWRGFFGISCLVVTVGGELIFLELRTSKTMYLSGCIYRVNAVISEFVERGTPVH